MSFGFGFALPAYPLRGGGGNNPFNQSGPTLDLSFTGVVTDLTDPNGYTLNTNFIIPQYQIAAQYVVWETGVGLVDKTFSQIITFTRASTGTYFDSAGVLQTAAIDAPRLDYNPSTLAAQGLLIEEQRTNSIRNNTMQGAVAGTPGTVPTNWVQSALAAGLTANVLGTGTSNGITYIDIRISGTTADTTGWSVFTDANTQIAASSGQVWTGSSYVAIIGGSTANITLGLARVVERNSGGGYIAESNTSWAAATATLANNRFSVARTLGGTAAFVQFGVYFQANSGVAIDITLRIGLPQLELGAFATSVIPTTTTALTRSADVASVNTLSPWYNATQGTIFCQGLTPPGLANFPAIGPALSDGTTSNRIIQYVFTNGYYGTATTSGASQGNTFIITTPTIGAQYKFATAYANNDSQSALNGTASTVDNTYTVPTVSQMQINTAGANNNYPNSWIQRITYYPRRLSQAELTAITT